jgi:putative membrane protein
MLSHMKTKRIIPYLLAASTLVIGVACSSTNTDATGGNASSTSGATGTQMGADMNSTPASDANSGVAAGGGATSPGSAGTSGTAAPGANDAADINAFMGTFATMKDPIFLLNAASSNMLEIQSGQLAAQRATNPEVKSFAQMMVSHHTQATNKLKNVARPLGVTMPPPSCLCTKPWPTGWQTKSARTSTRPTWT